MKLILSFIVMFGVLSCSSGSENQKIQYKKSAMAPSLEVPPDLTMPNDSLNKSLPGSTLGTRAATGDIKGVEPLLGSVLPKFDGVTLQGQGDFYWLEVKQDVATLYGALKRFWAEEGYVLEQDEPLIGVMKTEFLDSKSGSIADDDSMFKKFFSFFTSSDTKEQYMTRVERGESDTVSHIYLSQSALEYMLSDSSIDARSDGWKSIPSDPELEVELLSRMMLFLGMQNDQIKEQLAKIGQFPKRAVLTKNEDGVMVLLVKESPDRGWNRVLLQLDRLGVEYITKDRDEGIIRIRQTSNQIKDKAEQLIFNIEVAGTSTQATAVKIVNNNGVVDNSDQATVLLQYLFEQLK